MEKIFFEAGDGEPMSDETGEELEFYVLEQTKLGGIQYILVADEAEGDGEALILKDVSAPEDTEALYEIVEDETELDAVAAVFENILDDVEITGMD